MIKTKFMRLFVVFCLKMICRKASIVVVGKISYEDINLTVVFVEGSVLLKWILKKLYVNEMHMSMIVVNWTLI